MTIDEKFAKLRQIYPEEIEKIEAEEQRVSDLLKGQEYSEHPVTKELIRMCRMIIADARIKLATNRALTPEQRNEFWQLIESREWFVKMVAKDYTGELEQIDRELEAELTR